MTVKYFPCHRKIFSLCLRFFPCVKAKFPVFSLSGKSKNQIPCFPCAVATLWNAFLLKNFFLHDMSFLWGQRGQLYSYLVEPYVECVPSYSPLVQHQFIPLSPFTATVRPANDCPRTSPSKVASYTSPNSPSPSLSGSSEILKYQQVQRINVGYFIPRPTPKNFCCPLQIFATPPSKLLLRFSPTTTHRKRSGLVIFLHFNQKYTIKIGSNIQA